MSRPAGWLADHLDRRRLAVLALGWSMLFCAAYPFVPGVLPLLILGTGESLGFAIALPACQSLLGEGTSDAGHGRAQGLFASAETGSTGLAAAAAGALFGVAAWIPFVGAAACCAVLLAVVAWLWVPVPGRVRRQATPGGAAGSTAGSTTDVPAQPVVAEG
jgi:DHA1 family multidrug resistance protein-like MFS transporter